MTIRQPLKDYMLKSDHLGTLSLFLITYCPIWNPFSSYVTAANLVNSFMRRFNNQVLIHGSQSTSWIRCLWCMSHNLPLLSALCISNYFLSFLLSSQFHLLFFRLILFTHCQLSELYIYSWVNRLLIALRLSLCCLHVWTNQPHTCWCESFWFSKSLLLWDRRTYLNVNPQITNKLARICSVEWLGYQPVNIIKYLKPYWNSKKQAQQNQPVYESWWQRYWLRNVNVALVVPSWRYWWSLTLPQTLGRAISLQGFPQNFLEFPQTWELGLLLDT